MNRDDDMITRYKEGSFKACRVGVRRVDLYKCFTVRRYWSLVVVGSTTEHATI
jgi:hypothetical protein